VQSVALEGKHVQRRELAETSWHFFKFILGKEQDTKLLETLHLGGKRCEAIIAQIEQLQTVSESK